MLTALPKGRWNYETAAHLLNRAGFGGTPEQIERFVALGHARSVEYLVDFEKLPDSTQDPGWAKPDPDRFKRYQAMRNAPAEEKQKLRREEQRNQREQITELRQWWLERMAAGSRPLQEKLAVFWHGHFATSAQKVKSAYFMWRQNDIFRRHGSGNWLKLLTEVSRDPAMLIWLDQAQSRKEKPNENFAREVMELFALGEGHYTEQDVTEAARAFTGWSLDRLNGEFIYRARAHDEGAKTIFGKTGNFNGESVLKLIVEHPQSAPFITRKLWSFFAQDNPSDAVVKVLAQQFRATGYEFKPVLRTMFLSEAFYSGAVMRQQVKSPVQWLVGSVRLLERPLPPAQRSAAALRLLGQDLLLPPNVKGWDGGLSWITTNNLLNRYNFAQELILGNGDMRMAGRNRERSRNDRREGAVQVRRLFGDEVLNDTTKLGAELERRFIQGKLSSENHRTLMAYLESQGELDEADLLHAIHLVMATPEYQLT